MFVLQALDDMFFRDRTTSNVANKIGIDEAEVLRLVEDLAIQGYVEQLPFTGSINQPFWRITPEGHEYLKKLKS